MFTNQLEHGGLHNHSIEKVVKFDFIQFKNTHHKNRKFKHTLRLLLPFINKKVSDFLLRL